MRLLLLLPAIIACGSAPPSRPSNQVSHVVRPRCNAALVERIAAGLRERWHVDRLDVRCAAGSFGTPGFFLEARNAELHRTGIVDASGAELVAFVDEPDVEPGTFINGYLAADLDNDGEDEIIESWRRDTYAKLDSDNWLIVRRISNGRFLPRIQGPFLSRYHPDLEGGCSATWEFRRHAIVVAVQRLPGIPPTDCLPAGKHSFALHGTRLMNTPAKGLPGGTRTGN